MLYLTTSWQLGIMSLCHRRQFNVTVRKAQVELITCRVQILNLLTGLGVITGVLKWDWVIVNVNKYTSAFFLPYDESTWLGDALEMYSNTCPEIDPAVYSYIHWFGDWAVYLFHQYIADHIRRWIFWCYNNVIQSSEDWCQNPWIR